MALSCSLPGLVLRLIRRRFGIGLWVGISLACSLVESRCCLPPELFICVIVARYNAWPLDYPVDLQ